VMDVEVHAADVILESNGRVRPCEIRHIQSSGLRLYSCEQAGAPPVFLYAAEEGGIERRVLPILPRSMRLSFSETRASPEHENRPDSPIRHRLDVPSSVWSSDCF
jgi:hypothetical protein